MIRGCLNLCGSVDIGENLAEPFDYPRAAAVVEDLPREETCNEEKVEELAEIICRANDRCAAALVVLRRTLEKSAHAKPLVNKAKHLAFAPCAKANLLGMVDTQTTVIEAELLAGKATSAISADLNGRTKAAHRAREILCAFAELITKSRR